MHSAAKAVTAFVVHMLHERGSLDISDRVCQHIPGYDRHGKGEITIGQVLAHRAGVPNFPREALDLDRALDREFRVRVLCDARPFARPGRLLAYNAVTSELDHDWVPGPTGRPRYTQAPGFAPTAAV